MNFRREFDGIPHVRQNIFPLTSREADRQAKAFRDAGDRVEITHEGPDYFVWRAE